MALARPNPTRDQTTARGLPRPLLSPAAMRRALPASDAVVASVERAREEFRALLYGWDRQRLALIVGPCSVHDAEGALDYARRLARIARELEDDLLVLMRVFVEKPRTSVGWKGLVNDPTLDGRCDVGLGLATARRLLLGVAELGLGCATELLDPFTDPYLSDLISWGGIGARTSESPVHRQLASRANHPIGFKNGTDGDFSGALHGMRSAKTPHVFPAVGTDGRCVVERSPGNPDVHLVLRGGRSGENHRPRDIAEATRRSSDLGAARPVLVDCSHDNSRRDPARQPIVCRDALAALASPRSGLLGLMLESYLAPGRQDATPGQPLRYGVSITDACLGWNETEVLLREIAEQVRRSRA